MGELAWAALSSIATDFRGLLSDEVATDRASVLAAAAWVQEAMTWNPSLETALEALGADLESQSTPGCASTR